MNRRRIIIIAIGLGIIGLLAFTAYLLLRNKNSATDTAGNLPEIGGDFSQVVPITSDLASSTVPLQQVSAYRAFSDGSVIGVTREGKILRVLSTTVTALSSSPVSNFASASFSADGKKILVITGNQPRIQVNIFDIDTAAWRVIPGTFRDATWSPKGYQLATLTPDPKTGKTAIALYDTTSGKTVQTIISLALGDVSVSWPNQKTIIVADKPNAHSTGSAWAIDIATKKVTLAARGKLGFDAIWDGSTASRGLAIEGSSIGRGGTLSLLTGGVAVAKFAFVTMPEKCVFTEITSTGSSTTPYAICAVPQDQDILDRVVLPDSWLRHELVTDDVLIGIDLSTKAVTFTVSPPTSVDATRLQVVGNTIYYADRISDTLYKSDF